MGDLNSKIINLRKSVVAIMGLKQISPAKTPTAGQPTPATYNVNWGSGFCIVDNKFVVTVNHNLMEGNNSRNKSTKFYAFIVPNNDNDAYFYPVKSFVLERKDIDMAILELGPCSDSNQFLKASPITLSTPPDGANVLSLGFPAPEVHGISADANGNFKGGSFLLKSYANKGIIAAQYILNNQGVKLPAIEFNIAWNHGESGGPVATQDDEPAIFSLMQHYRNVQSQHGIQAGPRRGLSLHLIKADLQSVGAKIV